MTIEELKSSDKQMLTPSDIKDIVGADAQTIRTQAKTHPELLGFPVTVLGSITRIPRIGFLHWYMYGNAYIISDANAIEKPATTMEETA